jgi:hypothetical protein
MVAAMLALALLPVTALAARAYNESQLADANPPGREDDSVRTARSAAAYAPGHEKRDEIEDDELEAGDEDYGEDHARQSPFANFTGTWDATQAVSGTVHEIGRGGIELRTQPGSRMVEEVVLPRWYTRSIGFAIGGSVNVTGAYPEGAGYEQFGLVPFQISVGNATYGNATLAVPVWLQ